MFVSNPGGDAVGSQLETANFKSRVDGRVHPQPTPDFLGPQMFAPLPVVAPGKEDRSSESSY